MLTDEVVHPVAHHVGGLGGAVEAEVLGHRLLLLGGLAHLLKHTHTCTHTHTVTQSVPYLPYSTLEVTQ